MAKNRYLLLKKEFDRLSGFTKNKKFSKDEILEWVADCTAFFHSLSINEALITQFIGLFDIDRSGQFFLLGPFHQQSFLPGVYRFGDEGAIGRRDELVLGILFRTAQRSIEEMDEIERLVPRALIDSLSGKQEYGHLISSLEVMEQRFTSKDAGGLCGEAITLLGSVLNLDKDLAALQKIASQLKKIQGDESIRKRFGVSGELVMALNNSRLLRNYIEDHKGLPIEYNLPFWVAVSSAFLVILFLEITLATGVVIGHNT